MSPDQMRQRPHLHSQWTVFTAAAAPTACMHSLALNVCAHRAYGGSKGHGGLSHDLLGHGGPNPLCNERARARVAPICGRRAVRALRRHGLLPPSDVSMGTYPATRVKKKPLPRGSGCLSVVGGGVGGKVGIKGGVSNTNQDGNAGPDGARKFSLTEWGSKRTQPCHQRLSSCPRGVWKRWQDKKKKKRVKLLALLALQSEGRLGAFWVLDWPLDYLESPTEDPVDLLLGCIFIFLNFAAVTWDSRLPGRLLYSSRTLAYTASEGGLRNALRSVLLVSLHAPTGLALAVVAFVNAILEDCEPFVDSFPVSSLSRGRGGCIRRGA